MDAGDPSVFDPSMPPTVAYPIQHADLTNVGGARTSALRQNSS